MDSPLPVEDTYSTSPYHLKELEKAYKRLAKAKSLSRKETDAASRKEHARLVKHDKEYIAEAAVTRTNYEAMLERVYAWEPPTEEHVGLKKFMVEQLATSIEFDCGGDYWENHLAKLVKDGPLSGDAWKAQEIEKANRDIEYHTEEMTKDKKRHETNTAWIQALIKSLPEPVTA